MSNSEPSHRRGKAVDDSILAAVIDVIEADGTLVIRVDDVAAKAGVNKTTIYRRYPNRDDLVLAAMLAQADMTIPIPDEGALRDDLMAVARLVRDTVTSPLGRALLSASALTPELESLRPTYWQQRFDAAAIAIERAVDRGQCQAPDDASLLIELMVAPIHFRASQVGHDITDDFLELQVDRLVDALA